MKELLLFFILLFFVSCTNTGNQAKNITLAKNTMNDTTGQNIEMTVLLDSVFTIKLTCSAGQGFSWKLSKKTLEKIEFIKEDFANINNEKDGGDGLQTFFFKARKTGSQPLQFEYLQPFLKKPPSKYKNYSITIINNEKQQP